MARTRDRNGKGRKERERSHEGRTRRPNLVEVWKRKLPSIRPGRYDFEFTLLRGRGWRALRIGGTLQSVSWVDEAAALTGSLVGRRPVANDPSSLPIERGTRVRCRVRYRDHDWRELWTMRCAEPEVDLETGELNVELADDLSLVRGHVREWSYRKTKRRKKGWRAHRIVLDVAETIGLKVGELVEGTTWVKKITGRMSGLDVIRRAYEVEHKETRRRYIVRMRNGKLEVVQYRRNRVLYSVGDQIVSALLRREGRAQPTTVIVGKAKIGKGSDTKKIEHTEHRRKVVRKLGYVEREKNYGRVDSKRDLIKQIRRDLADELKMRPSATVSFPGVPYIRRGDACEVDLPAEGYRDDQAIVFVTRAAHTIDTTSYRTEIDVIADDPFEKYREQREKELRAKKRRERRRRRRRGADN